MLAMFQATVATVSVRLCNGSKRLDVTDTVFVVPGEAVDLVSEKVQINREMICPFLMEAKG
jgi:hypothetical protein